MTTRSNVVLAAAMAVAGALLYLVPQSAHECMPAVANAGPNPMQNTLLALAAIWLLFVAGEVYALLRIAGGRGNLRAVVMTLLTVVPAAIFALSGFPYQRCPGGPNWYALILGPPVLVGISLLYQLTRSR